MASSAPTHGSSANDAEPCRKHRAEERILFDVGDRVVYPHHGAAIIVSRETREFNDEKTDYLVLKMAHGDLTLSVPADKAEEVGMRPPIGNEEIQDLFELLGK